jgi:hypothetical protein
MRFWKGLQRVVYAEIRLLSRQETKDQQYVKIRPRDSKKLSLSAKDRRLLAMFDLAARA